ncbi:EAL domain-containing protein [Aquipuribacter nitratireducens]|uniref:EAL domain-containing protein n=1 Tax=Aquipuribacter nitratireducens TaxID=650104 RepID=A0ABW0GQR1_9MICO
MPNRRWSVARRGVPAPAGSALVSARSLLAATLASTSDGILVVDTDGAVVACSAAFARLWHVEPGPDACDGRALLEHAAGLTTDPDAFRTTVRAVHADPDRLLEDEVELADGRVLKRWSGPQHADGVVVGRVWGFRDRTAERRLEAELRRMAFYDELTGLANRALFMQRGRAMADQSAATGRPLAVAVLDLDTLKVVNDDLGHQAGDELLRTTATRLVGAVRPGDLVARLGGDEFGVLLPETGPAGAAALLQRMCDAMGAPVLLCGRPVATSISGGSSASGGTPEVDLERLLHEADLAINRAKADGRARVRAYDEDVARADPRRVAAEVTSLLTSPGALRTVFQPICDLGTGVLVGHEALTRFPGHAHREVGEWFGLARATGHGAALEAAAILRARAGHRPDDGEYLTVNVSPAVLGSPEVRRSLAGDLHGLVVEVTEDSRLDLAELARLLDDLRSRGARVAMDDTGAGYDGLRRLVVLRPEVVKLDRELVHQVHVHPEKRAMVEAMVSFCRQTGASLCAEGIETAQELRTLADLGVHLGQGWYVGRPAAPPPPVNPSATTACGMLPVVTTGDLGPLRAMLDRARTPFDVAQAARAAVGPLGADDAVLSALDVDTLVVVRSTGWTSQELRYHLADYPATAECLRTGQPLTVRTDDPAADPGEVRVLRELGYGSVVVMPLRHDDNPIGLLEVFSRAHRSWSDRELRLCAYLAEELADALDRVERTGSPAV